MGVTEDIEYRLSDSFEPTLQIVNFVDMYKKLTSNNTTIKNQYINLNIALQNIKSARSRYLPSLSLNGGYSLTQNSSQMNGADMITSNYNSANVGLSFKWNIYSGGSKRRALQISKINKEISEVSILEMKHSLKNQLLKLLETYNVQKNIYELSKERLETSELNMSMSTKKFNSGAINSFNYRDVQIGYQNSANSHNINIYNLIDSWLSLLKLTGGIVEVGK